MEKNPWKVLVALLFLLVSTIPAAIWGGYVLTRFWIWFVVPVFSVQALSVKGATGIVFTVGYLIAHRDPDRYKLENGVFREETVR